MIFINYGYGIFGHGVSSAAMTWMFLYPLLGGVLLFFLISAFTPEITGMKGYRLFFNTYNSGIAALTSGSFLKGVLEIAGTSSLYILIFYGTGALFLGTGLVLLWKLLTEHRSNE